MSQESSFYHISPVKTTGRRKRKSPSKPLPMRPVLIQTLQDMVNQDFIYFLSDFLPTKDLIRLQAVNQLFKLSLRIYLPTRLQQEADYINIFIEGHEGLNREFMKLVDTQIPISNGNWVCFDFVETLKVISESLSSKEISELKFIVQNIKPDHEILLAPFCLLMGVKPERKRNQDGSFSDNWRSPALSLMRTGLRKRIADYEKDTIKEEMMLEAFEYLNRE